MLPRMRSHTRPSSSGTLYSMQDGIAMYYHSATLCAENLDTDMVARVEAKECNLTWSMSDFQSHSSHSSLLLTTVEDFLTIRQSPGMFPDPGLLAVSLGFFRVWTRPSVCSNGLKVEGQCCWHRPFGTYLPDSLYFFSCELSLHIR